MQAEGQITMKGTPLLDDKTQRVLDALHALGAGWHSRMEIAKQIGKTRLNPVEIVALDMLATNGQIERSMQVKPNMPQINQVVYRLKEQLPHETS